jgi:hypothetical protein
MGTIQNCFRRFVGLGHRVQGNLVVVAGGLLDSTYLEYRTTEGIDAMARCANRNFVAFTEANLGW